MKEISKMLHKAPEKLASGEHVSSAGTSRQTPGPELTDAINRMFAEFELAYHNQFHKAWAAEGELRLAKKYWCSALESYSPAVILAATRHVTTTQTFLPTLSALVTACENAFSLFGLPPVREAYREACLAPEPRSVYRWSHPAVYLAGKACDWFELSSQPEDRMLPVFEHHYRQLCSRVLQGEELATPTVEALPDRPVVDELTQEQQQERLAVLRNKLGL